jgi:hypothetical protein
VKIQEEALGSKLALRKLNDYLLWFLMGLEVILLIEFFLIPIGASQNKLFVGFMYDLTVIPLFHFKGIMPSTKLVTDGSAIEWSTLVALVIYFFVFYGLKLFVHIIISSSEDVIRPAINSTSFSNYQQLTKAIRMKPKVLQDDRRR